MNCDEFNLRFQSILDERRDPATDEPLSAHAKVCRGCGEMLATATRVSEIWNQVTVAPFPRPLVVVRASSAQGSSSLPDSAELNTLRRHAPIWALVAAAVVAMVAWSYRGGVANLRQGAELPRTLAGASSQKDVPSREVDKASGEAETIEIAGSGAVDSALFITPDGLNVPFSGVEKTPLYTAAIPTGLSLATSSPMGATGLMAMGQPVALGWFQLDWDPSRAFEDLSLSRYRPNGFVFPREVLWEGPVTGSLRPVAESFTSTFNLLRTRIPI